MNDANSLFDEGSVNQLNSMNSYPDVVSKRGHASKAWVGWSIGVLVVLIVIAVVVIIILALVKPKSSKMNNNLSQSAGTTSGQVSQQNSYSQQGSVQSSMYPLSTDTQSMFSNPAM